MTIAADRFRPSMTLLAALLWVGLFACHMDAGTRLGIDEAVGEAQANEDFVLVGGADAGGGSARQAPTPDLSTPEPMEREMTVPEQMEPERMALDPSAPEPLQPMQGLPAVPTPNGLEPPVLEPQTPARLSFAPRCEQSGQCGEGNSCRAGSCVPASCGDAVVQAPEVCDDGNDSAMDGCEVDCTPTRVFQLARVGDAACALFSTGQVKCWGRDIYGVFATAGALDQPVSPLDAGQPLEQPSVQVNVEDALLLDFGTERRVVQIDEGQRHLCALFEDGFFRCWGNNEEGQLGTGDQEAYGDSPGETLAALPDASVGNVVQIAAGPRNTCILRALNPSQPTVICWGSNSSGQLGRGHSEPVFIVRAAGAVPMPGVVPVALSVSNSAVCALLTTGRVLCWGNNSSNGLAGAGSTNEPSPDNHTLYFPGGADQVTGETCAFRAPDTLYCWGSNSGGRFGTPLLSDNSIRGPAAVDISGPGLETFSRGSDHGCGVSAEGRVYCLGIGDSAEIGYVGRYDNLLQAADNWRVLPNGGAVDVGDLDGVEGIDPVRRVLTARNLSCAEMEDYSLRCWGVNVGVHLGYSGNGVNGLSHFGDDETPAEAYRAVGRARLALWPAL